MPVRVNARAPCAGPVLAVVGEIAREAGEGVIEVDPWDAVAWLDVVDPDLAGAAPTALTRGGFLPAGATFEVLSFVHAAERDLSLRLFVSDVGFGDRARHFLLRYFVDDAHIAAMADLFSERDASLWVEGNRVLFLSDRGDPAASILAFGELTAAVGESIAASEQKVTMFCEMPARLGRLVGMDRWGSVPLLHGVEPAASRTGRPTTCPPAPTASTPVGTSPRSPRCSAP